MKRIIIFSLCALFLFAFPVAAYADNGDNTVSITVVIPQSAKPPTPTPAPTPPPVYLYPASVWESQENGRYEIIRTYELSAGEHPKDISRESFTRDGLLYELADITKKETANADVREHKEVVTVNTATNDMAAILRLLEQTMDFQSDDGYIGVLSLDIASITVETAGTQTSNYTVSATREYPHLSSNDTSLIPKTITDNGRTLTLASIDWRTQNTSTVDYVAIPDSYTAVATYTGTASRTTVTGYITKAEYNGVISKILTGKTVYTAHFIGVPIVSPITPGRPSPAPEPTSTPEPTPEATEPTIESPTETEQPIETGTPSETESEEPPAEEAKEKSNILPILIALLMGAGISGGIAYFYVSKNKKKKEEITPYEDEEETID